MSSQEAYEAEMKARKDDLIREEQEAKERERERERLESAPKSRKGQDSGRWHRPGQAPGQEEDL